MKTMHVDGGFLEELDHPIIQKIEFHYQDPSIVFFQTGTKKNVHIPCNPYHSQYGIAASEDGNLLFQGNWYAKDGLIAYDIVEDRLKWKMNLSHVSDIVVYNETLVVALREKKILQINTSDCSVVRELQSGTIERIFQMDKKRALIDRVKGKLCVVDLGSLEVISSFPNRIVNPGHFLSLMIHSAHFENDAVVIEGVEGNDAIHDLGSKVLLQPLQPFRRVLTE